MAKHERDWPKWPRGLPSGRCEVDNVNGCAYVEGYDRVSSSWEVKTQDFGSKSLGNDKAPSK